MAAKNCTGKFEFKPGDRFGRLEVLSVAGTACPSHTPWLCRCDCGTETVTRAHNLVSGDAQSCGCLRLEKVRGAAARTHTTHGDTGSTEYSTWKHMKERCYRRSSGAYAAYGGRGIGVCAMWRENYAEFLSDMGRKPTPQHSLDRIDNDGDYSPENCRWATSREQNSNRRDTRSVAYGGQTYTLTELARKAGLKGTTLSMRLDKYNWPIEKAVETPVRGKR